MSQSEVPSLHSEDKRTDDLESLVQHLSDMAKNEPGRYEQVLVDLERATRGENPADLDRAVRYLSHETRSRLLRRLAKPAAVTFEPPQGESVN